ncbi:MAG: class I SAM-dependent methyltransferase [Bacteroidota bacterium]
MKKEDFVVVDHFKSNEKFRLKWNDEYQMFQTSPIPKKPELAFYYQAENYISHSDSSNSLFEFAYRLIKKFMLKQKISWIKKYVAEGNAVDIGCGTGDFAQLLLKNGFYVTGVEPNADARNLASQKIEKVHSDFNEIKNQKFDLITMWHVLEHIYDLPDFLQSLKAKTNKGAYAFIAVPNFNAYDAQFYKDYWAAYDVPRHLHHFSDIAIKKYFDEIDFDLIETKPLFFDAFYVSLLSEKYQPKSNYLRGIFIGLLSNLKARRSQQWSSQLYVLKKR